MGIFHYFPVAVLFGALGSLYISRVRYIEAREQAFEKRKVLTSDTKKGKKRSKQDKQTSCFPDIENTHYNDKHPDLSSSPSYSLHNNKFKSTSQRKYSEGKENLTYQ